MYVIFPLDQLLDIDSADKNKSKRNLKIESGGPQRHSVEVLSPTHPGQKLPGQQPLTSPVNQSPTALSGAQQTPPQEKAIYRGTPPSSPSKSPPSTLPLPSGGPPQYQQQVSSTSSGANGCSLTPPSPTTSLGLPTTGSSSIFLGLKKKVAPSVSWGGSTPRDDQKVTRSVSFYSCRDQPVKNSVVSPGLSQSGRSSVSPNRQIGPSGEFQIPRNQLIYSDSFRSERESFPKEERSKNRQLARSESVVSRKTDTLELKEHRSSVKSVQKLSEEKSDPMLKVEPPQTQRLSESPQRQRSSEPPQKQRPTSELLLPKQRPSDLQLPKQRPSDLQLPKQRLSESPQRQRFSEPPQKQRPTSELLVPKQRPSELQLPKLILSEPGQELANFAYFTGSPESAGLEGSFSFSDARVRNSNSLTRGGSVKKTRGLTPSSPSPQPPPSPSKMAGGEPSLKDLTHPTLNETLKCHNAVTFKLIKTVSDFSAQLSHLHERHAEDLQHLVENFRKKHSDLRNEKAPCASLMFQAWESLLQEVEVDSQLHSDVAGTLIRQVSRPLIEKTFHRKIQSRKLFTHRESIETILAKTEDMLKKCRKDHMEAYQLHCRKQDNTSLAAYFDAHNAYVQQLYATNAMLHFYNTNALPGLLQELEEVYLDVGNVFIESILQGSEILSVKAQEQNKRYDTLALTCRTSDPHADISCLVKYFDSPNLQQKGIPQHRFILPQPPAPPEVEGEEPLVQEPPVIPPLRNELVLDRLAALSSRSRVESLKREGADLEKQIAALQEGMEALLRGQQRNLESCLYHKANELQEDISMKRFDLRVNQVHLAAVKAQKELFASKEGPNTDSRERKMSNSSTGSMKSKWMKAFKSLKTPSGGGGGPSGGATGRDIEKKNGRDPREGRGERGVEPPTTLFENAHILQEYTYKKITACDVCHQILRGHSRQGLKCRLCKTNVHFECQERLPRCAPKSRLLRRQRSTSEIESKQIDAGDDDEPEININMLIASQPGRRMKDPPSPSTPTSATAPMLPPYKGASPVNPGKSSEEVDLIYQVLKQAGDLSGRRSTHGSMERDLGGSGHSSGSGSASSLQRRQPHPRPTHTGSTLTVNPPPIASSSAPISPRRQKLSLRMKSFSLDSPESTEQRRRHGGSSTSAQSSHAPSYCQSPSSPVHNRRLLSTRTMRMSSVELPDDNEKSLSSASTSPCPSPKPHRLLPTNLYVVLYNFTSRHPDELDLRAGYKVTVTDTSDPDWWQGKCLGRMGYFPSKYVTRLNGGEKPLQVTHNLQVSDGENGIKLLRDQIVIQIGEEIDGMVMIRNGDNQQGVCPVKYLQEA